MNRSTKLVALCEQQVPLYARGNFDLREPDPTGELEATAHARGASRFETEEIPLAQKVAKKTGWKLEIFKNHKPGGVANRYNFVRFTLSNGIKVNYNYRYAYYEVSGLYGISKRMKTRFSSTDTVDAIIAEVTKLAAEVKSEYPI